ncbi:MAG: hypothetical protein RLZ81_2203 [Pseudomonadota bacterium]|jgi:hypothetical protein
MQRVPLLMLGFVALFVGAGAGLVRLAWPMPTLAASAAGIHGPLMVCGFFGVVISLERAVALARWWAYLGPFAAGLGTVLALAGAPQLAAASLYVLGGLVLLAASLDVFRRQRALFTFTLVLGALAWVLGAALWAGGWPVHRVVPWWMAFLVLTIAGERLELSRFMPPSPAATRVFAALLALIVLSLPLAHTAWGTSVFAAALLALALWLVKQDIARRTVRAKGLTRFVAVCLLSGYFWLALGASVMLAAQGLHPGSAAYDAALHAIMLGFVFAMVFGHAPIIFPAVLRVPVPYHTWFYGPLALLHGSLLVRLAGDVSGNFALTRLGGALNALALLAFILSTVTAVLMGTPALPKASKT